MNINLRKEGVLLVRLYRFLLILICFNMVLCAHASDRSGETRAGFVTRFISTIKAQFTPEEIEFDASRRAFIKKTGGAAGGAVLMASGGTGVVAGVLDQARRKLPKSILKKLAGLRQGSGGAIPLDKASFLKYKAALERELARSTNVSVRTVIRERLNQMAWAVENRDGLGTLASIEDRRADTDSLFSSETQRKRIERRLQRARDRLIRDGKLKGLEIQVLTARTLLDNMLLKKIAYQIKFVNPEAGEYAVVLNREEIKALRQYSVLINSLEKSQAKNFEKHSFLSNWLPLLRHEVDMALENYELSVRHEARVLSCRGLL